MKHDGKDSVFRDHEDLDGKSKDELMDYVEYFWYSGALLQGSKSFPMPLSLLHGKAPCLFPFPKMLF
jgi:hypothetical protein